jgi:glyoxylate reductase
VARIVITDGDLEPESLAPLGAHHLVHPEPGRRWDQGDLAAALPGADALICFLTERIDAAVLARADALRVIGNVAAGVNNIDLAQTARRGIVVCNTPDGPVQSTADLTLLLMLAASRRLPQAEHEVRTGTWTGWRFTGGWGRDLRGLRLGLVGYGRIARAVHARAEVFGMTVRHHARHDTGVPGYVADLTDLLRGSDVLSVHVPLTDATRNLIDGPALAALPRDAIVVNTARGGIVDEPALLAALHSGHVFAAGLDVFDGEPQVWRPLLAERRLVLTPHVGSATRQTRLAMLADVVGDVAAVLRGEKPRFPAGGRSS